MRDVDMTAGSQESLHQNLNQPSHSCLACGQIQPILQILARVALTDDSQIIGARKRHERTGVPISHDRGTNRRAVDTLSVEGKDPVVTISGERARIKRRMVREAGLDGNRLVSSHTLDIPVLELYRDKDRTQERLVALMREARERGPRQCSSDACRLPFSSRSGCGRRPAKPAFRSSIPL